MITLLQKFINKKRENNFSGETIFFQLSSIVNIIGETFYKIEKTT